MYSTVFGVCLKFYCFFGFVASPLLFPSYSLGRDERRAPLKTPAWEATCEQALCQSRRARGTREKTRKRGAAPRGFAPRSLVRSRAARFTRLNRRACSLAIDSMVNVTCDQAFIFRGKCESRVNVEGDSSTLYAIKPLRSPFPNQNDRFPYPSIYFN